jgi:hypothetical protein
VRMPKELLRTYIGGADCAEERGARKRIKRKRPKT